MILRYQVVGFLILDTGLCLTITTLDVDIAACLIPNATGIYNIENDLEGIETRRRRKKKKDRSTSSSEAAAGKKRGSTENDKESLELSTRESSSSSSGDIRKPKSTEERKGWRKWHRKCPSCPEDMAKKWRDPSINWICGAYQRARRTFKSLCMMHYRNCQDGTMFVKIHDNRCANDTPRSAQPYGMHFFYDYKVDLSDDSSKSSSASSGTIESSD